jgi:trans-aconitate 2-methyltransferase
MISNLWSPKQYNRFESERNRPVMDLIELIQPLENMNILDLGCGTGQLTRYVHDNFKARSTLGIDSSPEMLMEGKQFESEQCKLMRMKIEDFQPSEPYDLIFSNAALQWVDHHQQVFSKLCRHLTKQGQVAIQIPSNYDYPTHTLANAIASEEPFASILRGGHKKPMLNIDDYSSLLYDLGFQDQIVRQQVYACLLDSTESLIDWVRGSLLTYYKGRLSHQLYNDFLKIYRKRLVDAVGWSSPFLFPMKRILIWGKK